MFFFVFHLNYFELTTFVDRQTPSLDILLVILNKSFAVQFFLCKLASVGQLSQTLSSLSTIQGLELIAKLSLPLLFVFYSFSIRISFPSLFLSKKHQSAFNSNLSPPIRMQIRRFIFVVDFFSCVNTVAYVEF